MAGPLGIFRKYQKILLAVFGVLLMIVFTVGGLVNNFLGSNRAAAAQNQVVLSWKGGELRDNELQIMRYTRNQLRQFQAYVLQTAEQRAANRQAGIIPNTDSDESLVQTMLLAQRAREMGLVVSDNAVLQNLVQLSDNTIVESGEFASLLQQATGGRMLPQQLFEALREELLAQSVQEAATGSVFPATPGASFEYFSRLQRRIEAEVMPIPVEDYVEQVQETPTESEISELYEEYKDTFSNPASPDPGFKRRKRAAFQYAKADFQDFLDRAIAGLTDEEIEEYYDTNKNTFRKLDLPSDSDIEADSGFGPASDDETANQESEPEADSSAVPTQPESSDLDIDEQAGDSDTDSSESAEETTQDTSDTTDEELGSEGSDEVAAEEDSSEGTDRDEGELLESSDESGADDVESVTEDDELGSENEPADEEQEAALFDDESDTGIEETTLDGTDSSSETEDATGSEVDEDVQYKPLEEVRDEITMALGRPKAQTAMEAAIQAVDSELDGYYKRYVRWEALRESDEETPPPSLPNLEQLAAENNLSVGKTPLVDALGVSEYEIGTAYDLNFAGGRINRIPFAAIAFSEQVRLFKPQEISASDVDSKFLYWKTEEKPEFTPTLEQAKEDVVRAWKMRKARELAQQQAEQYAKQVRESQQSLTNAFANEPNRTVSDTGEFTWMSFGSLAMGQGIPQISNVEGVEYPGEEFMRDVFAVGPGGVTVTTNYPRTTVYVVYVKSSTGNQQELQDIFLKSGITMPVLFMARQDSLRTAADWYRNLEDEYDVNWERDPRPDSSVRQ